MKMKEREELEYQMQLCNDNNNYITMKESQTAVRSRRCRNNKLGESPAITRKQSKTNTGKII